MYSYFGIKNNMLRSIGLLMQNEASYIKSKITLIQARFAHLQFLSTI